MSVVDGLGVVAVGSDRVERRQRTAYTRRPQNFTNYIRNLFERSLYRDFQVSFFSANFQASEIIFSLIMTTLSQMMSFKIDK